MSLLCYLNVQIWKQSIIYFCRDKLQFMPGFFSLNCLGISTQFINLAQALIRRWHRGSDLNILAWLARLLPSILCWHIWKERNKARYEGIWIQYQQIITQTCSQIGNIFKAFSPQLKSGQASPYITNLFNLQGVEHSVKTPMFICWSPPPCCYGKTELWWSCKR